MNPQQKRNMFKQNQGALFQSSQSINSTRRTMAHQHDPEDDLPPPPTQQQIEQFHSYQTEEVPPSPPTPTIPSQSSQQSNQIQQIQLPNEPTEQTTSRKPLFQRNRTKTVSFGKGLTACPVKDEEEFKSSETLHSSAFTTSTTSSSHMSHQSSYQTTRSTPTSTRTSSTNTVIAPIPTNSNRITFSHKPLQFQQSLTSPRRQTHTASTSSSGTPSSSTTPQLPHRTQSVGFGASMQPSKPKNPPRVTIGNKHAGFTRKSTNGVQNTDQSQSHLHDESYIEDEKQRTKKLHFSSSQLSLSSANLPIQQSWVSPSAPSAKPAGISFVQRHDECQQKNVEIYLRELELKTAQLRRIAQQQQVIIDQLRQKLLEHKN